MARLRLTMLGGFEGRLNGGQPLMLSARKAWALLAYLALPPGRIHPRDKLTALLWGGVPETQARASLRQALFTLRRALGEEAPLLVQEGEGVGLDARQVEVDAVRLERELRADGHEGLDSAIAFYRGDLLSGLVLDEPPFEEWLVTERERLRELALEGLAHLLARQREMGHLEAGVGIALRLLAIDPLQESVHRTLMRLYAQLGRRGDALRHYRECVAVLQRELEADPEAETRQLYQEILRDRLAQPSRTDLGPVASDPPAGSHAALARPASEVEETPLVGRALELDRLRTALDGAWSGGAHLVLVRGEAGIGKSRLIAEATAEAARRGGRVLVGQCHESDQALPFGPWVDLSRSALAELGPDLGGLSAAWRAELARLLPELADGAPPAVEGPVHHRRLFEAVAAFVQSLAGARPLLLVLEDIHWADEPSLQLLASLGRRLGDTSALVVASVRDEELADLPERRRLLDVVGETAATVTLGSLSRADTVRLVAALGRRGADAGTTRQLADRVWAVSEGHPLMIVEATRVYRAEPDALAPASVLPDQIHHFVVRRLRRVSEPGRAVLAVAAVAGREVDFAVLERAAGLGESKTAAAVEELVRRRLLREVGESLALAHDRVREVVYGEILATRRRLLHRRVAEALEAHHAGRLEPHLLALGLHFRAAEVWDEAARYLRRAARQATERGAYREAVAVLEQAQAALERVPPSRATLEAAIDLRLELRNALLPLGEFAAVMARLREAVALAEQLGDVPRQVRAAGFLVNELCMVGGEHDRALRESHRSVALAETLDDPALLVLILTRVAQVHHLRGAYRLAGALFRRTLERSASLPPGERLGLLQSPAVHCRYWLAASLGELGAFEEAAGVTRDCVAIAEGLGQPLALSFAWAGVGTLAVQRGRPDDAMPALRRALEFGRRDDDPPWAPRFTGTLGYALALAGDVTGGQALINEALARMVAIGVVGGRSQLLARLGEVRLLAGDASGALESATEAVSLAERHSERGHAAWALRARAEAEAGGRGAGAEAAARSYRQAAELAGELEMQPLVARCRLGLGILHAKMGKRQQASTELAEAHRLFRSLGMDTQPARAEEAPNSSP